jgi:hypothetical protein
LEKYGKALEFPFPDALQMQFRFLRLWPSICEKFTQLVHRAIKIFYFPVKFNIPFVAHSHYIFFLLQCCTLQSCVYVRSGASLSGLAKIPMQPSCRDFFDKPKRKTCINFLKSPRWKFHSSRKKFNFWSPTARSHRSKKTTGGLVAPITQNPPDIVVAADIIRKM